ncbi:rab guanyl-nucleotide exchange factor [Coprinopsis sp. MPI-PUGE-AT-0042]|nr:rab guanyl-nucleotide exchange factor [Coprinopsis sp. MPI-PUGE-AT-0042]
MTASDISTPLPVTASSSAMGAFTGLTGYMTLGLMSKPKPIAAHIKDSEVIITKDVQGFFIGPDAKASRTTTLEWPAPPEDVAVMKPYILSVLPAGVTTNETTSQPSNSTLQIHSSLSLNVSQTLPFPFSITQAEPSTQPPNATLRLLTPSASSLFLLSTPADKTAAANDGSQVWEFQMKPWDKQLDELVLAGEYSDALALLDTLDDASLPDKSQRRTQIRALNAVAQFRDGHFDQAIDTFIELDFNPAKVVALYPETISGRLAVSQERWIPLYGGPERAATNPQPEAEDSQSVASNHSGSQDVEEKESPAEVPLTAGSLRNRMPFKTAFGSLIPGGAKDDDTASIMSKRKVIPHDAFHRSIETLVRFLTDRRPKLFKALETIKITPANQTEQYPLLSKTPVEDLFSLPNAPLSALTPEQLLRFAQVGDTALYRAYRIIRPTLVSTFCRSPNWCEVSELEEDLYKRKNFPALKDLYRARGMHAKALNLLQQVAEDEDDLEEKLDPSIQYLQQLGPEHLPQIFESARWVIDTNHDMGFNIFISDDVELPHRPVADYLESIEPKLCIRYLEHILVEKQDESSEFHDRLGELYLRQTLAAKKRGDDVTQEEMYSKLLHFLDGDQFISLDRLYGLISSTELYEARAILLGRLGRHDQALESYVYRLHDYIKAEEYCKRVYQPGTETEVIFLTLLRIYLRPTTQSPDTANLLKPALDLISRHSPRIDSVEILQLLPPLVTAQDVKEFLVDALRAPVFDARVISQVSKARNDHLARKLVGLQTRRVKVTDSRICPQCHKRIGNSVIAVHSPHGEVTHYQCREPFARKLAQTRR